MNPSIAIRERMSELRELYGNLFMLMDSAMALAADDPTVEDQLSHMNADIANRMQIADARLRRLRKDLGDWRRRDDIDPVLGAEILEFFTLLDSGLTALERRVMTHMIDLRYQQTLLADSIRQLQRNRQGVRKYKSGDPAGRLFKSEV